MTILLDSNILIDHFNNVPAATAYLRTVHADACVSVITRAEVLVGFTEDEAQRWALPMLDAFPTLEITRVTADEAAALRRQHRWKLPDALQAALARQHGLQLATRNTRDFDPDRHPFIVIPYRI